MFSPPIRREPDGSDQPQTDSQIAVALGDYLNTAANAGIPRSIIANTSTLRFIADGVSFKVFRASYLDRATQQRSVVAVKLLKGVPSGQSVSNYANKAEFQEVQMGSLVREIKVLCHSSLRSHENLLHIIEWGFGFQDETGEQADEKWDLIAPFFAVEFAEHGSLKKLPFTQTSWETKRELCLDVILGLGALHSCDIAHGDVKLENILIFPHSERKITAKLSDFGHSFSPSPAAVTSAYFGSDRCQPPEVDSDHVHQFTLAGLTKCDIWAFGVAALEVFLDGDEVTQHLGVDQDASALLSESLSWIEEANEISSLYKSLWKDVVQHCLMNNPEERGRAESLRLLLDSSSRSKSPVAVPVDHTVLGAIAVSLVLCQSDGRY